MSSSYVLPQPANPKRVSASVCAGSRGDCRVDGHFLSSLCRQSTSQDRPQSEPRRLTNHHGTGSSRPGINHPERAPCYRRSPAGGSESYGRISGISLSLSSQTDGSGSGLLQVQPFANATEYEQLPPLGRRSVRASHCARYHRRCGYLGVIYVPNVRLPDLSITDHPQIAVREIPVSQFTVFSAGDSFTLGTTVFSQDIGRVFSESTLSVAGSFSSEFTVVAGQNVNLQEGSLRVRDPSGNDASVTLANNTQNPNFLPDARTSLDSRVVTGNVLPIDSAALNSVYASGNSGQDASNGLNLALLKAQCDVLVVARPDIAITTPNGKGYLVTAVGKTGGKSLTYALATNSAPHSQATPGQQTVAFAAAQNKQNPSQTILTLGLSAVRRGTVCFCFHGRPKSGCPYCPLNAVILIRGAQGLAGPLSIVSPHPIIIAGDFNSSGGDDAPPASIITPANLQTVAADWGSDLFGNF